MSHKGSVDLVQDAIDALNQAVLHAAREDGRWFEWEFTAPEPDTADRHLMNKHPVKLLRIAYVGHPPHPTTGALGHDPRS